MLAILRQIVARIRRPRPFNRYRTGCAFWGVIEMPGDTDDDI